MGRRQELDAKLVAISPHTYFQPPASVQMEYPAIVYRREPGTSEYADNLPYAFTQQYELTVVSKNPDEPIVETIRKMQWAHHARFFVADNLNHDVFTIYY